MTIRKMDDGDLSEVLEIENESFVEPWKEKDWLSELHDNPINTILVATIDNEIVGFLDYMITFNSATINQIAVKKTARQKGVASSLLKAMYDSFIKEGEDRVEFLTLEVRKSNEIAQKLYLKENFEIITEKHHYYPNGEDAIYMVKRM